jgi:hypothetical protein
MTSKEYLEQIGVLERKILLMNMRYIQKKIYSDIASELYVSLSTFKRRHEEALVFIVVPEKFKSRYDSFYYDFLFVGGETRMLLLFLI